MNYIIVKKGGGEGIGACAAQHIIAINVWQLYKEKYTYYYVSQKKWGLGNPGNYTGSKLDYIEEWENFFNFKKLTENLKINNVKDIQMIEPLDPMCDVDNTIFLSGSFKLEQKQNVFTEKVNKEVKLKIKNLIKPLLQKRPLLFDNQQVNISMYIRRGDVPPERFTPIEYYIDKYNELREIHKNSKFYIFTENKNIKSRFEFPEDEMSFFNRQTDVQILTINPFDAIYNMIYSDVFVGARSASSHIVSLYTDATCYTPPRFVNKFVNKQ